MDNKKPHYDALFDLLPLPSWVYDLETFQILDVNQAAMDLYGYTKEEFLSLTLEELRPKDEIPKLVEVYTETNNKEGNIFFGVFGHIKKNGEQLRMKINGHKVNNLIIESMMIVGQDVTEEEKERQQLKLLESVVTNTTDAVLITEAEPIDDSGPKIIYVNKAFTKMTGYKPEEVIGKTPRILQGPRSDRKELDKLKTALRNWESCEITTVNYKKNGDEFWINISVSPVANENGWFTHWIAIERDVTDQKQKDFEKELIRKISLNYSLENDLTNSSYGLCRLICDFGEFDFVELWLPNLESTNIQMVANYSNSSQSNDFYKLSKDIHVFDKSEGFPSAVWNQKSSILWSDITSNNEFLRKDAARISGIKSILGIPLLFNKDIVGVMLIGTKYETKYLDKYKILFQQLENFIGSEINRKKLENDLQHLHNAIPDLICLIDLQGRFIKINKAGCELLGYSENEILYRKFEDFVHPDDIESSRKEFQNLLGNQTSFKFENRYLNKTGEIVWMSWKCTLSFSEGIIFASARNITSEKKLRELSRLSSKLARIGSWEIDVIGDKLYWTDMVYELHEIDPKNYSPDLNSAILFYREDFQAMVSEQVNNCLTKGKPFDFEAVIVTSNKYERWIRAIGNAEMYEGKCSRIYGSFQDIQERKETELRFQSLSNNLPGVVFQYILYPNGTDALKYVTKGSNEIWGYTPEEVMTDIELVWDQTRAGGDFEAIQLSIQDSIRTKSNWVSTYKSISPDGQVRTLFGTGTPNFLSDGTVLFNSVVLDITKEAKKSELLASIADVIAILLRSPVWEEGLDHSFKIVGESVAVDRVYYFEKHIDPNTKAVLYSQKFEWNSGSAPAQINNPELQNVPELLVSEFISPLSRGEIYEAIVSEIPESNMKNLLQQQDIKSIIALPILIENQIYGFVGFDDCVKDRKWTDDEVFFLRSITSNLSAAIQRQMNQMELKRANEELEQFAFITSHDLQEPLRMITSFMDQLKRKYEHQLDEKALQYIHFATDGAKRMKQIILDLLDYSRAGKFYDSIEEVDANEIVEEFKILRRKVISEKSVSIETSDLPTLTISKAPLTQIFHIIIDNAIKYTQEGIQPSILISAEVLSNEWKFKITDNGIGIGSQFFEKIFAIFQRLHNRDKYEGTGIGLAIAKKIIESWGGKIWLESKTGEGSTFFFTIPKDYSYTNLNKSKYETNI